jgi:hypothetical protein
MGPQHAQIGDDTVTEKNQQHCDDHEHSETCGCGSSHEMSLPEPSLIVLGEMLFSQGMLATGAVPNPYSQKVEQDLTVAQFQIGLMEALVEKTRGNRTPQEDKVLEEMLHALRVSYVAACDEKKPGRK